jgi:hypothetical protein
MGVDNYQDRFYRKNITDYPEHYQKDDKGAFTIFKPNIFKVKDDNPEKLIKTNAVYRRKYLKFIII